MVDVGQKGKQGPGWVIEMILGWKPALPSLAARTSGARLPDTSH